MAIDSSDETPVGDGRKKHVTIVKPTGERTDHGDVFVKHTSKVFLVSSEADFPDDETTRFQKSDLLRAEISQHHAACFITTAAGSDEATLRSLRRFRDGSMVRTPLGRLLIWIYERASPPIARTLTRYPTGRTTRLVRWLIERCAGLARRHRRTTGLRSIALAVLLTGLYVWGMVIAAIGTIAIRLRDLIG
jgi:hypothetical protein